MVRRSKGFTLMEIICVVWILAALAAILSPVLARSMDAARRTRALTNLRQLHLSLSLYREDWGHMALYGKASDMGLPTKEMLYRFYPEWRGTRHPHVIENPELWASPCGQHPSTPPADDHGINLSYGPTDLLMEPWVEDVTEYQDSTVFIIDKNCNDRSIPLSATFYLHRCIGVRLSGSVHQKFAKYGCDTSIFQ